MQFEDIHSDARAVRYTAEFFEELKQSAARLINNGRASERGYFTPSEDEEVRHLLVSYWQSRNALIEVVTSYKDYARLPDDLVQSGFLVSFAGALILIDAARFLREGVHKRSVVREKLNEPEPSFGIPKGVYDRIQRSLTNPVHVWHLYHASRFFEEHEDELKTVARDHDLETVLEIVLRLRQRLQISVSKYSVTRLRTRVHQMVTIVRKDLFKRAMYGLQKTVSRLLSDKYLLLGHEPQIPEKIQMDFEPLLKPGDVLVNRKEHALTNYFLPGFWPHALLYIGNDHQLNEMGIAEQADVKSRWQQVVSCSDSGRGCVIESLKDGVRIRSMESPFRSDSLLILRPRISKRLIADAIGRVFSHDGKPYDFDFDFSRSDRLVCTEVIYRAYEGVGGMAFQLTSRAGRLNLSAEDIIRMSLKNDWFDPIAVYCSGHSSQIVVGDPAKDAIEGTL